MPAVKSPKRKPPMKTIYVVYKYYVKDDRIVKYDVREAYSDGTLAHKTARLYQLQVPADLRDKIMATSIAVQVNPSAADYA